MPFAIVDLLRTWLDRPVDGLTLSIANPPTRLLPPIDSAKPPHTFPALCSPHTTVRGSRLRRDQSVRAVRCLTRSSVCAPPVSVETTSVLQCAHGSSASSPLREPRRMFSPCRVPRCSHLALHLCLPGGGWTARELRRPLRYRELHNQLKHLTVDRAEKIPVFEYA
jgi:hypothetical protein